jgi:hypothetical protein
VLDVGLVDRSRAQQRRRGERQQPVAAAQRHEPGRALLHHLLAGRGAAGLEPGVARAERRVAGERQLARRGEDATR